MFFRLELKTNSTVVPFGLWGHPREEGLGKFCDVQGERTLPHASSKPCIFDQRGHLLNYIGSIRVFFGNYQIGQIHERTGSFVASPHCPSVCTLYTCPIRSSHGPSWGGKFSEAVGRLDPNSERVPSSSSSGNWAHRKPCCSSSPHPRWRNKVLRMRTENSRLGPDLFS